MNGFVEQLRLAEKAAEDIYFAKVNRELIEYLHKRIQTESESLEPSDQSSAKAPKRQSNIPHAQETETADITDRK
jgi:hypothetical protein